MALNPKNNKRLRALELAVDLGLLGKILHKWWLDNPKEVPIQLIYGQLKRKGYIWNVSQQLWCAIASVKEINQNQ